MAIILAAVLGLVLGSFLSVLLERLPEGKNMWGSIVSGRSQCPKCHHTLAWYDLIPLVSYLMLMGTCRYCKERISPRYPVLEISTAVVFGVYVFLYGAYGSWQAMDLAILFCFVALFFFDLRHRILPDVILGPLAVIALVRVWVLRPDLLVNSLATGVLLGASLLLLYVYSGGRWLGFGDVKLSLVIGILFGYPGAIGVTLLAIWAGALWGIVLMSTGRATMKTALPFGSFWTTVAIVTIIWPGPIYFISGLLTP